MPAAAARPPPELPSDLVEEFLVRLPRDDPAQLVRAALVCKSWCRLLSGSAFRRRYRDFHGAPPMFGFFANGWNNNYFVRTSSSICPPFTPRRNWKVLDARHGRVLLHRRAKGALIFMVWVPITSQRRELPWVSGSLRPHTWNAAVLCDDSTCDHLDCGGGKFLVVLVGTINLNMFAYVYSSEIGVWRKTKSVQRPYYSIRSVPSALVGNALYFLTWDAANRIYRSIIKYNLDEQKMSVIQLPANHLFRRIVLMTTEGGGLGFATMVSTTLNLWSWEANHGKDAGWKESRSIELNDLLSTGASLTSLCVVSCVDCTGIIFLHSDAGIFAIDLKSNQVTKVCKETCFVCIYPYLSFYTSAFGASIGDSQEQMSQALGKHKFLNCRQSVSRVN